MGKQICNGGESRKKILEGIKKVELSVSKTYGPRGRLVAYYKGANLASTKDGLSVARQLSFSDELENMGALLIKEAASKANYVDGDGSSLTTILTGEFCKELNNLLNLDADINELKIGFQYAKDESIKILETIKRPLSTIEDIRNIASVSCNGDKEITDHIVEAFESIGEDGIVSIGDSLSREGKTSVTLTSGLEIDKGYASSKSVNTTNDLCDLQNPLVLICGKKLEDYSEVIPIIEQAMLLKQPLIIMAPSYDELVVAGFGELLSEKRIQGAMILLPGLSKSDIMARAKDIAMLLNCRILFDEIEIDEFKPAKDFGQCENIRISKSKTTILGPKTDPKKFEEYITGLKDSMKDNAETALSQHEIDSIKERIAKISGGIATIRIGALNEIELGEKKDRYEDAINAVRAATSEGFLPGAGSSLLCLSYKLMQQFNDKWDFSQTALQGAKAFLNTIRKPAKILIKSTGNDPESIVPDILTKNKEELKFGFNARNSKIENLVESGIIDPYKVIKNSILFAASVAEIFMNIDLTVITDIKNLGYTPLDPVLDEPSYD